MSDFKVKLQKLIDTSYLNDSITLDTTHSKPTKTPSRLKMNLSSCDITFKTSKQNYFNSNNQTLSTSFVSSNTPKRQFNKAAKDSKASKAYSPIQSNANVNTNEVNGRKATLEQQIRSCTPQDLHRHHHIEPILFTHVNVNEHQGALRSNGRMKRKVDWVNKNFQVKDSFVARGCNYPVRGTDVSLKMNRSEICSRSPNQKNRIEFNGEFKEKIKRHLFDDHYNYNDNDKDKDDYINKANAYAKANEQLLSISNIKSNRGLSMIMDNNYNNKGKSSLYNSNLFNNNKTKNANASNANASANVKQLDIEVERYRREFMKIMKTSNDLSILNK